MVLDFVDRREGILQELGEFRVLISPETFRNRTANVGSRRTRTIAESAMSIRGFAISKSNHELPECITGLPGPEILEVFDAMSTRSALFVPPAHGIEH